MFGDQAASVTCGAPHQDVDGVGDHVRAERGLVVGHREVRARWPGAWRKERYEVREQATRAERLGFGGGVHPLFFACVLSSSSFASARSSADRLGVVTEDGGGVRVGQWVGVRGGGVPFLEEMDEFTLTGVR